MKKGANLWQAEINRIKSLQWWGDVKDKYPDFPGPAKIWHIHPIGLIENFAGSQAYYQTLVLSADDVLNLKKTLQTEWVHQAGTMQAKGIIDSILNRLASGRFGPHNQFGFLGVLCGNCSEKPRPMPGQGRTKSGGAKRNAPLTRHCFPSWSMAVRPAVSGSRPLETRFYTGCHGTKRPNRRRSYASACGGHEEPQTHFHRVNPNSTLSTQNDE